VSVAKPRQLEIIILDDVEISKKLQPVHIYPFGFGVGTDVCLSGASDLDRTTGHTDDDEVAVRVVFESLHDPIHR
jgi:hypothetical protein